MTGVFLKKKINKVWYLFNQRALVHHFMNSEGNIFDCSMNVKTVYFDSNTVDLILEVLLR